jgi:ABC-type transport system involved in multi-copper enzyme maturation permease subunit
VNHIRIFLPFLRKEFITMLKSNIYLLIILIDVAVSIFSSILTIDRLIDGGHLVMQISLLSFFPNVFNFFLIFLIAPSISISDEKENGTWDVLKVKLGDDTSPLLAKILSQIIFSFILILVSALMFMLIYYSNFSQFPSVTSIGFCQTTKIYCGNFTGTFSHTSHNFVKSNIAFSILDVIEVILIAFFAIIPVVLISVLISKFSRTRINSIIISIGYYIGFTAVFSLLTKFNLTSVFNINALIDSLNPNFLFTVAGSLLKFSNVILITPHAKIFSDFISSNAPLFSYFAYFILISSVATFFVFFPNGGEIRSWLNKVKE